MKVVVAIDSLKGSFSPPETGDTIRVGILRADSSTEVLVCPLVDGGEGTIETLIMGMGGALQEVCVTGPLGAPATAVYDILQNGKTAILEMAAAVDIILTEEEEHNPLSTTIYGVGEMIRDAISKGCRRFIVGVGGSATNGGGIGMLQMLGYGLLGSEGKQVSSGVKGLRVPDRILDEKVMPKLADCISRMAYDAANTLCGDQGCSVVFGPQKGTDPGMTMQTDRWFVYRATLMRERYERANPRQAGTGAAGGLGFTLLTFTDAQPESGIKIMLEETRLEDYVKEADLVITGEGRLDGQTVMGEVPIDVAHIVKQYGKPVIVFAGTVTQDATVYNAYGIDAFFPILRRISTPQEAMEPESVRQNMTDTVEQALRLFLFR